MKLYWFPLSPYSQKALIALEEKGAKYETELVELGNPDARAAYEKVNRFGKVPFLRDEARDWSVPESSIILEYVDRHVAGGPALIPSDPDLARQARFHDRVFDLYITEQALKIFFDGRRPADKRDPLGVESAEKRLDKTYALYDEHFAKRRWALGDTFSIGDVSAAPALAVARQVRPFDAHKNLVAYFGRLAERPSVQNMMKHAAEFMSRR
ncbi:MAG TPA: glutathione S-transferase family protein [Polyangia bacterium]|nr:glutathione S-transferase family protein [Polyangia bacterium]